MITHEHVDLDEVDSVDVQIWTVNRLVSALEGRGPERILRPSFQRGSVWDQDRQVKLIDSIRNQYPIGSLLFFNSGYEDNKVTYEVVDGLQRSHSLLDYTRHMLEYFSQSDVSDLFLENIVRIFNVVPTKDQSLIDNWKFNTAKLVVKWMRKQQSFSSSDGYSAVKLAEACAESFGHSSAHINFSAVQECEILLEKVKLKLDISEYKMPVIIFTGNRMKLPDIFERLNTGGIMLNKYDILGSCWDGSKVTSANEDIIKSAQARLEIINVGAAIAGRKTIADNSSELDFFDYICAVGSILSDKHPDLFPPPSKKKEGEPAAHGFTLSALAVGIDTRKDADFRKLPLKIKAIGSYDSFVEKLLRAASLVEQSLKPLLSIKVDGEKRGAYHKELQMASMVASIFRVLGPNPIVRSATTIEQRLENLLSHYFLDCFRSYWSATADAKALSAVINDTYTEPASKKAIRSYVSSWYAETLDQPMRGRLSAKLDTKSNLFLKAYLASLSLTAKDGAVSMAPFNDVKMMPTIGVQPKAVSNYVVTTARQQDSPMPLLANTKTPRHALQKSLDDRFAIMLSKIIAHFQFPD